MTDWKLPWTAACRCERVRLQITQPPLLTMACHCRGCQRMTASAYSLSVAVPTGGFVITEGEPVIGGLHGPHKHYFCAFCLSWMFTKPDGIDFFVNVRASLLDDPSWYSPFAETSREEGFAWAQTGAPHSYEGTPDDKVLYDLVAKFADHGPRPQ